VARLGSAVRLRLVPLLAIAFAAASALLLLVGGTQQPCLLIAQLIGNTALALLGLELWRRRSLRALGGLVLGLAAVTYVLLAQIAVAVLAPLTSG